VTVADLCMNSTNAVLTRVNFGAAWREEPVASYGDGRHCQLRSGTLPNNFKTDDALREQRHGGFDSRALPPYYTSERLDAASTDSSRTHSSSPWNRQMQHYSLPWKLKRRNFAPGFPTIAS
jgi:hypothetical protein